MTTHAAAGLLVAAVLVAVGGCASTGPRAGPTAADLESTTATTEPTPVAPGADASSGTTTSGPGPCPGPVPPDLGLDPFYDRYCDVLGIPLVADEVVDPAALQVAAKIMREMLAHRPDVAAALAQDPVRVGIIGRDQGTTDMPEWSDLDQAFPDTDWDTRTRGVGATPQRPLVGAGEENLLCLPQDRYRGESIFVHELSHTVLVHGVEAVDPRFRPRLELAFARALADGRWRGTYAATNSDEYWAEAVQSYFDTNLADDSQHNEVDTRAELEEYDPALSTLIEEVFGDGTWRPTCPS